MGFGDLKTAADMRDAMERIARGVLRSDRPEPFLAKVYDIDLNTQKARVMATGETLDSLLTIQFAFDKIPQIKMADTPELGVNAPGDIVRVMKVGGS
jgi:hypothetical protein